MSTIIITPGMPSTPPAAPSMPGIPAADYGRQIGRSETTVKRWIRAGKLRGYQDDRGRWLVCAEPDTAEHARHADRVGQNAERAEHADHAEHDGHAAGYAGHDDLRAHVATLTATVDDLRRRLDASEQAQAELRRLLTAAIAVKELPEKAETASTGWGGGDGAGSTPRRPWWQVWRRCQQETGRQPRP